jgi:hypothetical protein
LQAHVSEREPTKQRKRSSSGVLPPPRRIGLNRPSSA